jgi:hypothetical protein
MALWRFPGIPRRFSAISCRRGNTLGRHDGRREVPLMEQKGGNAAALPPPALTEH